MRKIFSLILICLFALTEAVAQSGTFVRHKTLWTESIYSISRKYAASVKEVAKINNLSEDKILEPGEVILIPTTKEIASKYSMMLINKEEYQIHFVKSGETVSSVAQHYNCPENIVKQYNKDMMKNGKLIPNAILIIPRNIIDENEDNILAKETKEEIIQPQKRDFLRLNILQNSGNKEEKTATTKTATTKEDKVTLNQKVQKLFTSKENPAEPKEAKPAESQKVKPVETKVKAEPAKVKAEPAAVPKDEPQKEKEKTSLKELLKGKLSAIKENTLGQKEEKTEKTERPEKTEKAEKAEVEKQMAETLEEITHVADTIDTLQNQIMERMSQMPQHRPSYENHRVAIFLPLDAEGINYGDDFRTKTASPFFMFYQGLIIAAHQLAQENVNLDITMYDTASNDNDYQSILEECNKNGTELLIGPIENTELQKVLSIENEIMVVSPLDPKAEVLAESNKNFIQIQPSEHTKEMSIANFIQPHQKSVALMYESGSDLTLVNALEDALKEKMVEYQVFNYDVHSGRTIGEQLTPILSMQDTNTVIVASNSEAFVSDVLRNLNLMHSFSHYPIRVFGTSAWRSFETLDLEAVHALNVCIPQSVFADYNSIEVQEFVREFRRRFETEPDLYAFQGYDVLRYFGHLLHAYGKEFPIILDMFPEYLPEVQLLQSSYLFRRQDKEKGFVNEACRFSIYNEDFSISLK